MKDSREEPKLLGELNLTTDELLNEDCIGRINFPNTIGQCSIYIYSNEGTIPHFHIIPKNNVGECCVCIFEPFYFNHGSKQLRLNSKQRKMLNNWMNERSYADSRLTNWDAIVFVWKVGNGNKYVPKNPIQPNYTDLINMKG